MYSYIVELIVYIGKDDIIISVCLIYIFIRFVQIYNKKDYYKYDIVAMDIRTE